ncbi:MAG: exodeoxyribonuclease VII small subunit [Coriobacteriia bacterium]|nr:exodeoxyribonuclease VII small subunit [Coriobacteriia bacterium]
MEQNAAPISELTFRQAMSELTGIVNVLEGNTLELEDSLKQYERGVALLAELQKRLAASQQRVDTLMGQIQPEHDDHAQDTTVS